ncbi:MAG: HDOD domain-containing protein [Acidobacteriota bacterium]
MKEELKNFIADMGSLPSLPSLYLQLTEELRSPEVSANRVSRIISKDLAMTSKILQIVNSAYFGLSRQISSVERAILLMGLEMLRTFVLSAEVFSMFEPKKLAGLTVAGLWRHSMSCSSMARRVALAESLSKEATEHVCTAAFLHDIGKLLMANEKPDSYRRVSEIVNDGQLPCYEAEENVFGFTHAEAGGVLLTRWNLPEPVVDTVLWHHDPIGCTQSSISAVAIVHVTNFLEHEQNDEPQGQTTEISPAYLEQIGAGEAMERWREAAAEM